MSDQPIQPFSHQPDPWVSLRAFTPARIALGRTGVAIPLQEVLQFRMAHAHARDAVYSLLATTTLAARLTGLGYAVQDLHSRAADRHEYLQRPDKGRRLNEASVQILRNAGAPPTTISRTDQAVGNTESSTNKQPPVSPLLSIVLADGLSATAVNHHAIPLLEILLPQLQAGGFSVAPINLVQQGRVAIGDEIGMLQEASMVIVLIGERPGLSSPDSLGIYLTYRPVLGLTDEARNCISNIRPGGLSYQAAADKLYWFIRESTRLQISGVGLKDEEGLLDASTR
ncbi:ethanolamine ammonia-lyase subunit EutC [Paraflavitalea pollutisoli]|uniref:ethanolamine ammonia-lyase subunit EutC n=1 Tax=Paraflavitalea pollutisoli TaxID=3034143 RepID=UPI0023EB0DB3|nr:ethanolamine ammonia-lyase subunit EutC [Paraflavitalea sp. H1-2-19X]